eukprot:5463573-Amphidinium_carterae.1
MRRPKHTLTYVSRHIRYKACSVLIVSSTWSCTRLTPLAERSSTNVPLHIGCDGQKREFSDVRWRESLYTGGEMTQTVHVNAVPGYLTLQAVEGPGTSRLDKQLNLKAT